MNTHSDQSLTKQNRAKLAAAEAKHQNLSRQHAVVDEKWEVVGDNIDSYKLQLSNAEENLSKLERLHILDEVTDDALAEAKEKVNELRKNLAEESRINELAMSTLKDISSELTTAGKEIEVAKTKFCRGEEDRLMQELGSDPEIRQKLLDSYSAMFVGGRGRDPLWWGYLAKIFPEPRPDEVKDAVNRFRALHGLELEKK